LGNFSYKACGRGKKPNRGPLGPPSGSSPVRGVGVARRGAAEKVTQKKGVIVAMQGTQRGERKKCTALAQAGYLGQIGETDGENRPRWAPGDQGPPAATKYTSPSENPGPDRGKKRETGEKREAKISSKNKNGGGGVKGKIFWKLGHA